MPNFKLSKRRRTSKSLRISIWPRSHASCQLTYITALCWPAIIMNLVYFLFGLLLSRLRSYVYHTHETNFHFSLWKIETKKWFHCNTLMIVNTSTVCSHCLYEFFRCGWDEVSCELRLTFININKKNKEISEFLSVPPANPSRTAVWETLL